jgi:hypothetical protein
MATNPSLMGLLTAAGPAGPGGRSILDQPLREVLLRAATVNPELHRNWASHYAVYPTQEEAIASLLEPGQTDSYDVDLLFALERERSDVASVARFGHRVECASFHLYVAFRKALVDDFELSPSRNVVKPTHGISIWYCSLVNTTFNRYRDLRRALLHKWTPPAEAEPLTSNAFRILSEITPAETQLRNLFEQDRPRAFHELVRHLDIVAEQLKAAIELATDLEAIKADDTPSPEQAQVKAVQLDILGKAGKALSLTEAAKELGVSRQALHKRIGFGSALGLMHGSELVVPDAQFVSKDDKLGIVDGLSAIVSLFDTSGAGRWSTLQFLTEIDPLLQRAPLDVLKEGDRDAVIRAARAYLSLDEA